MRRTLVVRSNEICPRCHCLGATVTVMVEQDGEDGGTEERIVELVECRANRCLPY